MQPGNSSPVNTQRFNLTHSQPTSSHSAVSSLLTGELEGYLQDFNDTKALDTFFRGTYFNKNHILHTNTSKEWDGALVRKILTDKNIYPGNQKRVSQVEVNQFARWCIVCGQTKLLSTLLRHWEIVNLDLEGLHIAGNDGAKVIAELLKSPLCTTLERLVLNRCCIGDEGLKAICGAIKENKTLKTVELRNNAFDISTRNAIIITTSLCQSSLNDITFNLRNNTISRKGTVIIAGITTSQHNIHVTHDDAPAPAYYNPLISSEYDLSIIINNNEIAVQNLKNFIQSEELPVEEKEIILLAMYCVVHGGELLQRFNNALGMKKIDKLRVYDLNSEDLVLIAEWLATNPPITHLYLGCRETVYDESRAKMVAKSLETNTTLTALEIFVADRAATIQAGIYVAALTSGKNVALTHLRSTNRYDTPFKMSEASGLSDEERYKRIWPYDTDKDAVMALGKLLDKNEKHAVQAGAAIAAISSNATKVAQAPSVSSLFTGRLEGSLADEATIDVFFDRECNGGLVESFNTGDMPDRTLMREILINQYGKRPDDQKQINQFARWCIELDQPMLLSTLLKRWGVTELNLDGLDIGKGKDGAAVIAKLLKPESLFYIPLTDLALNRCGIGDDGLAAICTVIDGNETLKTLALKGNNINITSKNVLKIADALRGTILSDVNLERNPIGLDGRAEVEKKMLNSNRITVHVTIDDTDKDMSLYALFVDKLEHENSTIQANLKYFVEHGELPSSLPNAADKDDMLVKLAEYCVEHEKDLLPFFKDALGMLK
jgi:hypothetical protein